MRLLSYLHCKSYSSTIYKLLLILFLTLPLSKLYAAPVMTSPSSGSTLPLSNQVFSWSANGTTNITQWWLYIGSNGTASRDIYAQSQGTSTTSSTIYGFPTDGSTINFRLWYYRSTTNSWSFEDFTYTACTGCVSTSVEVTMTNPADGSTFTQPTQIFNWQVTNGTVTNYWIFIGTSGAGSSDLYASSQGTNTQLSFSSLPTDGSTVNLRLWYRISGSWQFNDYIYTSCTGCINAPILTMKKVSSVISDAVNVSNPKRIPGATVEYTITATNSGFLATDNNSVVINDTIPTNTDFVPGSLQFIDGTPSSGLTVGTLDYASGNIQVSTLGQFAAASVAGNPSFQVKFKVKIQ